MALEEVEVKLSLGGKWILYVAKQVESQQTAAVVGTQWNLATGVCRHCAEALVGVAVGHTLADDGIPEENARLCRLPSIVDNLLPELTSIDISRIERLIRADRELLTVALACESCAHKLIVNLYRHVSACNLTCIDLSVDKVLCIGVLDE